MSINYNPKVGEVLQCDFGDDYPRKPNGEPDTSTLTINNRLPPEMVKKRLVVVLNGKLTGGCIVVPVSATETRSTTIAKYHVHIESSLVKGHDYFGDDKDRWALGEQVQQVSKTRLTAFHPDPSLHPVLPSHLVTKIQRAVVKALNAGSLLVPEVVEEPTSGSTASSAQQTPMNALAQAMKEAQRKQVA